MEIVFGAFLFMLLLCAGRVAYLLMKTKKPEPIVMPKPKMKVTKGFVEATKEAVKQATTNTYNFEELGIIVKDEMKRPFAKPMITKPSMNVPITSPTVWYTASHNTLADARAAQLQAQRELSNWEMEKLTTDQLMNYLNNRKQRR